MRRAPAALRTREAGRAFVADITTQSPCSCGGFTLNTRARALESGSLHSKKDSSQGFQVSQPVTQLLAKWSGGNEAALGELTGLVYQELRSLAQRHLRRERPNHTIQRTALVHEAFVRLVNQQSVDWQSRAHFFGLASNLMRRILVDHARARLASKRGGGLSPESLDEITNPTDPGDTHATARATPSLLISTARPKTM